MALELNLTPEDKADEGFKEYFGSCIAQRPLIVAAKRIPMRVAHLMGMRVLHPESSWMGNYFFCDDRVAYSSDNQQVKVGSRGILKSYGEHGMLVAGAIEFNEEHYRQLLWKEFGKSELALGRDLSQIEAKAMPFWFELSQRNQALLDAYVSVTYMSGKLERAMGMYLDSGGRANAWMGAWCVGRLDDGRWSWAGGYADLDDDYGGLVGIAPEALVRLEKRLYDEKRIHVDFVNALRKTSNTVVYERNIGRKRVETLARDAQAIEIEGVDEKHIPLSLIKEKFYKLEQGGKYRELDEIKKILLSGEEHET